jgi:hypothetical protein
MYGTEMYLIEECIGLVSKSWYFFDFEKCNSLCFNLFNGCQTTKVVRSPVVPYPINFIELDEWCEESNTSMYVLDEDLDNYEWFSLLKSEVDVSKQIPLDLSIKYGNAYLGTLLDSNINRGRQLYYRGLTQEVKFQLPMSGILSKPDSILTFAFSDDFKVKSWDFIKKQKWR